MCMLVTRIYDRAGLGIIGKMDVTTGNEPSGSRSKNKRRLPGTYNAAGMALDRERGKGAKTSDASADAPG